MSKETALVLLAALLATSAAPAAETALATRSQSAGGAQAGGHVQIHATLSGVGQGVSAGGAVAVKGGFAGQLADAQALALAADGTNVNETTSLALRAVALLDDDSYLSLTGTEVLWSGQSGPIDLITSGGLLLAGAVYQDTPAVAGGAWRGFTATLGLLVKDVSPDNYPTSPYNFANDGLPDAWQFAFFAGGDAGAAPAADGDGDGLNALAEYVFNTDPTSAASGASAKPAAGLVSAGGMDYLAVTFRRRQTFVTSLTYEVQATGALGGAWSGGPVLVSSTGPDASGMVTEVWRDSEPQSSHSQRFLRLRLAVSP